MSGHAANAAATARARDEEANDGERGFGEAKHQTKQKATITRGTSEPQTKRHAHQTTTATTTTTTMDGWPNEQKQGASAQVCATTRREAAHCESFRSHGESTARTFRTTIPSQDPASGRQSNHPRPRDRLWSGDLCGAMHVKATTKTHARTPKRAPTDRHTRAHARRARTTHARVHA
jgi:hypothetical protein